MPPLPTSSISGSGHHRPERNKGSREQGAGSREEGRVFGRVSPFQPPGPANSHHTLFWSARVIIELQVSVMSPVVRHELPGGNRGTQGDMIGVSIYSSASLTDGCSPCCWE